MEDYIEWDGTEFGLENIIIWWFRLPVERYSLLGTTCATYHSDNRECVSIEFVDVDGTKTNILAGDRIYYHGDGVLELVKHART